MLGPFATVSRRTPIHQVSLSVLSHAACASMSTTTTTTRDRGDRYGPMEWAQLEKSAVVSKYRPTPALDDPAILTFNPLILHALGMTSVRLYNVG